MTSVAALGIDLSTHGVHMALVDRDGIVETATVRLDGHSAASQVSMLRGALIEMPCPVDTLALIEQPYHGHDNPQTTIALARVAGMVEAVALQCGYQVRRMTAAEWRPLAGIGNYASSGNPKKPILRNRARAELKAAALRLVKLEYGLETADDNLAEAVLMARVALGLSQREKAMEVGVTA